MPRVIITVPDRTPQPYRFQLDRQVVMIGRGSDNDIAVDCTSMSVRHAEMLRVEGGYKLRDLGSTNGIKLDGVRYEVMVLRHGASVNLGDVAFDFQLSEEEREALSREKPLNDAPVLKPEPRPAAPAAQWDSSAEPKKMVPAGGGGGGFMIFLLLLLLALLTFFGGLSLRHYIQTGGSLIEAMQSKTKTLKANPLKVNAEGKAAPAPVAPAPAATDPVAPVTPVAPEPVAPAAAEPAAAEPAAAEPAPGQ